jgi:hypothetical protein
VCSGLRWLGGATSRRWLASQKGRGARGVAPGVWCLLPGAPRLLSARRPCSQRRLWPLAARRAWVKRSRSRSSDGRAGREPAGSGRVAERSGEASQRAAGRGTSCAAATRALPFACVPAPSQTVLPVLEFRSCWQARKLPGAERTGVAQPAPARPLAQRTSSLAAHSSPGTLEWNWLLASGSHPALVAARSMGAAHGRRQRRWQPVRLRQLGHALCCIQHCTPSQ